MWSVTGFIGRFKPDVISDRFYLQFYLQGQARCGLQQVLFAGSKPGVVNDRFYLQGQARCHQ